MIAHSVNALRQWGGCDRIVCSTDDDSIAAAALAAGADVPWTRPEELAGGDVGKIAVLRHALLECERERSLTYDAIVDVDVTAPLRTVDDIAATVALLEGETSNALTVTPARKNPYFNMVELEPDGWARLAKPRATAVAGRQTAPTVYELNASVYTYTRGFLLDATTVIGPRTRVHVMPHERSVDIDTPLDLLLIEAILDAGLATLPPALPRA